jgi:putative Mn2+ efflux pump MntP
MLLVVTVKFIITFFTIFFLAITLSADDFSVGIAYGLSKTRLPFKSLIIMVSGSATSAYGIMLIGRFIFTSMPQNLTSWISAIILSVLGCKMLYNGWKEKDNSSELVNQNSFSASDSKLMSFWETYLVGLGLGVDDFAQALGMSLAGFPVALTVLLLEAAEVIMLLSGNILALKGFSKKVNGRLSIIPGIVLILVAIYRILF